MIGGIGWPGIFWPATIGSTNATLPTLIRAVVAAVTSFSFTTISTGDPSPLGKCSPSFSSPITESVLDVKASVLAKPSALRVKEKPAKIVSRSAVEIQIRFGFFSTKAPIFAHIPPSCSSTSSKRGTFGQKIHRPKTTRRAGKNVRTVIIDAAIPIAPTGPKPLLPDN